MRVCCHRGFWMTPAGQNTLPAFERAFAAGFGAEIDVRHEAGRLVVSHDVPGVRAELVELAAVLDAHCRLAPDACLALNVKADGLQRLLAAALREFGVRDYFAFDMSVPDLVGYAAAELRFFTRQSELEPQPALLEKAAGVWVDGLYGDWATEADLARHWDAGRQVALVSPELHRRDHRPVWDRLRAMRLPPGPAVLLCTDFPEAAREFFRA